MNGAGAIRSKLENPRHCLFPAVSVNEPPSVSHSATPVRRLLYPAVEFVVHDLERLRDHGLETCDAPIPVLRSLQYIRDRHRCDVNAEFAEDSDRAEHMEI